MDIRVGQASRVGSKTDRSPGSGGFVEGKLLAVRAPRKRSIGPPTDRVNRRRGGEQNDPVNGRVLVLMIPDRAALPADLADGNYRVFLRFARR